MTERLTHQRSKGPASTPAQRLVELQNALSVAERDCMAREAEVEQLSAELHRYHDFAQTSFGGVPMSQIWADLVLWEGLLNDNKVDAIFELGTWEGGFSWWLYAQSLARDIYFQTYDAVVPERDIPGFYKVDVFAEAEMLGRRFRSFEPCIVFCDNGNKPRELVTFAAELRDPASLLVVHDWGTEIQPEDVPDSLVMVYGEFCEQIGSVTRVFKLRSDDA